MHRNVLAMLALVLLGSAPLAASAQESSLVPGQLVKAEGHPAVYYIDKDLTRHAFPNARVFQSWFADFDAVVEVSEEEIAEHPLAGLVPYKAAKRLVKIQTDPRVYAVGEGGVLRWVKNEQVARRLFGENWNDLVDDLADSFFAAYEVGDDIDSEEEFDEELADSPSDVALTLRAKRFAKLRARGAAAADFENEGFGRNKTAVCHKPGTPAEHTVYIPTPALNAHMNHGDTEGACEGDDVAEDETAPTISGAAIVDVTASSAVVEFTSDEETTAAAYYSTTTPVDTETADDVENLTLAVDHSLMIDGLAAATTYHVVIEALDAAGNMTTSSELTFTTEEEAADETAPTIDALTVDTIGETSATVHVTTDEDTTATVYYSTATPVDTGTADSVASITLGTTHDVELTGLTAETTYYAVVVAEDEAGNETTGAELTFTTSASS